jgi:hypothetical protein
MLTMAMTRAASGLLRALLDRIGARSDRILLSDIHTVDWQSLTFIGERHVMTLRVPGPGAAAIVGDFTCGIEEAEFSIPGQIVADIALTGRPVRAIDGSVSLAIEALTVAA